MLDEKPKEINTENLQYYFDAQERDTLDRQGLSRRASEVLRIRDKLLTLPEREFEIAVHSIRTILVPTAKPSQAESEDSRSKRNDAGELFDKTRQERVASVGKIGSL